MALYYVNDNAQTSGQHEVHVNTCSYFASIVSTTYLGAFESCGPAKAAAKNIYPTSDGCAYCCPACNTG